MPPRIQARKDLRKRQNLLKSVNIRRKRHLSPRARHFYNISESLLRVSRNLDRRCATLSQRLEEGHEYTNSPTFLKAMVNDTTYNFVSSQIKLQRIKPCGRRFSLDNKIFALSLIKLSAKAYRLLEKTFALPSRKTLNNMLIKIPFECGINNKIVENLKASVGKMKKTDKYCCIIFDEMSLDAGLTYNTKTDAIDGFDFGDDRKAEFADHVLVFMVRGTCRKWKQPIAYYFVDDTVSGQKLASLVKNVIRAVQSTGLKVMATVCDQVNKNTTALNLLRDDTHIHFLREGVENTYFGFVVNGAEIIPLYDPPSPPTFD